MNVFKESEHFIIFNEIEIEPGTILDLLEQLLADGYKPIELGDHGGVLCEKLIKSIRENSDN